MKSIAFFNNKGGVGKTTLLCNIAAYLAQEHEKRVLIIDADPQCNATQLLVDEDTVDSIYDNSNSFTVHSIIHPLSIGKGYVEDIHVLNVPEYGIDLLPGDPRLALKEDLLSKDWQDSIAGDIRGLRTSFLFSQVLAKCGEYDYVLFDMGPSLGSINRAVLLACDFFLSPMSIDIFSLKAIENITASLLEWRKKLEFGVSQADPGLMNDIPDEGAFDVRFLGYVAQQYMQKTSKGEKRAVFSYDKIMKRIPSTIDANFRKKLQPKAPSVDYSLGTIPNLFSLIPMSQSAHKPIFGLKARDGVRGAHFTKVSDAKEIFGEVADRFIQNVQALSPKRRA